MSRKPRAKIGVIGLGTIGGRVAAGLRGAGYSVYVWSRSPHPQPNFVGSAVEVADLCDVIQLFVSDDAALLEVCRTLAAALHPRHLVLAHPTVLPETAREAARIVGSQGARYLDAPFTGSKTAAANAGLVYYLAGSEAAQREARPLLEASSKKIVNIGEEVGQAAVVKLATNMMAALAVQGLSEALALARAGGVDPARFAEALEHNGARSGTSDNKLPLILAGNFEPHFALKHLLKDLRHALQLASTYQLSTPAAATTGALVAGAVARGWGELDFSALAKNYETVTKASSVPAAPAPAATVSRPPVAVNSAAVTAASSNAAPSPPPAAANGGDAGKGNAAPVLPTAAAAFALDNTPATLSPPAETSAKSAEAESAVPAAAPPESADQRAVSPPSKSADTAVSSDPSSENSPELEPPPPPRKTRSLLRAIFGLESKEESR